MDAMAEAVRHEQIAGVVRLIAHMLGIAVAGS
jgi:hypothetical protein